MDDLGGAYVLDELLDHGLAGPAEFVNAAIDRRGSEFQAQPAEQEEEEEEVEEEEDRVGTPPVDFELESVRGWTPPLPEPVAKQPAASKDRRKKKKKEADMAPAAKKPKKAAKTTKPAKKTAGAAAAKPRTSSAAKKISPNKKLLLARNYINKVLNK